jgi:hypothetical protein
MLFLSNIYIEIFFMYKCEKSDSEDAMAILGAGFEIHIVRLGRVVI